MKTHLSFVEDYTWSDWQNFSLYTLDIMTLGIQLISNQWGTGDIL